MLAGVAARKSCLSVIVREFLRYTCAIREGEAAVEAGSMLAVPDQGYFWHLVAAVGVNWC